MPTSGVTVPDHCIEHFKEMKLKHKQRCIIFVVKEDKEFNIYRQICKGNGDQKEEFDAIVAEMKKDPNLLGSADSDKATLNSRNPCVMVWDLDVPCKSGEVERGVLLFMKVCPDEGIAIKKKMVLASSIEDLKRKLPGVGKTLNIESMDDLNYEHALDAMK